jgi:hypothetical protein
MISAGEVLEMLCPGVEWSIRGDNYEDINWFGKNPAISNEEFLAGFSKVEQWQKEKEAQAAAAKAALLEKLGITEDEAKLLLS